MFEKTSSGVLVVVAGSFNCRRTLRQARNSELAFNRIHRTILFRLFKCDYCSFEQG